MYKKKIAVIGSGISGISASLLLSKKYDVYLFEKNNYLGGHTRTKNVKENNISYNIDTGFIVFNNHNYPDLVKFFEYLNIKTNNSNMSFSVSIKNPKIEYGSNGFNAIFSKKKLIFSIFFWKLLFDIFKLYSQCKKKINLNELENFTLEDFLNKYKYSKNVRNYHIYPIVSSIWSCDEKDVKNFPLISFINFFNNHRLFNFKNKYQWKFVDGGSSKYIESIIQKNLFKYTLNKKVNKIIREKDKVIIIFNNNEKFIANKVIIATHADQALSMIINPSENEIDVLSKFKYKKNYAYLHSDETLMPKHKSAWSSWNFIGNQNEHGSFSLTYWMNLLQNIQSKNNFFVSINPSKIPSKYIDKTIFEHPIFNLDTLKAQKKIDKIQGLKNTWYCGSYLGYGFHEDGIQSSAYIAKLLDINLPWKRSDNFYNRLQF